MNLEGYHLISITSSAALLGSMCECSGCFLLAADVPPHFLKSFWPTKVLGLFLPKI
jgi:hypothetical protein